jgi:hypothetical protein
VHAEKRASTTTALQKLFQMNSEFITKRATSLAARFSENEPRVNRIYEELFNRGPTREEIELADAFLKKPSSSKLSRWEQYTQSLLISNETLYVD